MVTSTGHGQRSNFHISDLSGPISTKLGTCIEMAHMGLQPHLWVPLSSNIKSCQLCVELANTCLQPHLRLPLTSNINSFQLCRTGQYWSMVTSTGQG